jgi:hypothetical protein
MTAFPSALDALGRGLEVWPGEFDLGHVRHESDLPRVRSHPRDAMNLCRGVVLVLQCGLGVAWIGVNVPKTNIDSGWCCSPEGVLVGYSTPVPDANRRMP